MLVEQQDEKRRRVLGHLSGDMGWAAIVRNETSGSVRCIATFMKSNFDSFMAEINS
ncbi:hypothetical protein Gotri_010541 [Gossypium trilobum]|uniref:Uncharacterized protein n=1 Tax=Gossypium trilobum TaxID=34281 RepID=A0A7J9EQM8_9ROSI|nr:hypothetical protein [Gossypium trilobum]